MAYDAVFGFPEREGKCWGLLKDELPSSTIFGICFPIIFIVLSKNWQRNLMEFNLSIFGSI